MSSPSSTRQRIRVNYGALNVEEFGSVYEGLLEYDPVITPNNHRLEFSFVQGEGRASSGSHYTPDELVQPLIQHSLDYLIEEKLQSARSSRGNEALTSRSAGKKNEPPHVGCYESKGASAAPPSPPSDGGEGRGEVVRPHSQLSTKNYQLAAEAALLSLRVCDVACGSGHILLNAARRIATELAIVRTGEDQPSPLAFREAVRDVIRHCIYGVDLNPLAVELCKVALWLEAHVPGESLNFLDHHIKCGNAIVGLAHEAELQRGIFERGGFDLIVGNPPYRGVKFLSGDYGHAFCQWVSYPYFQENIAQAWISLYVQGFEGDRIYCLSTNWIEPTPQNFLKVVNTLAPIVTSNDTVLIYTTGHGGNNQRGEIRPEWARDG